MFLVLEHLFPEDWLEKKVRYAFIIAAIYSTLGIIAARLLFGANSGIVSVIFTSLLILPYLQKMFSKEELEEEQEAAVSFTRFQSVKRFIKKNQTIRVYFAIFFGIYLMYAIDSFLLPQLGVNTFDVFKEQLFVDPALRGRAFDTGTAVSIITNNWWVLLVCFLLSIATGDGAIFFITWNASSWGALFGYRAFSAAAFSGANPLWYLFLVLTITLPHVLLEGGAYILAAISGNIISDEIIKEKQDIRNFIIYSVFAAALMFMLYFLFRVLALSMITFSIISILIIVPALHFIGRLFQQKRLKKVFIQNYDLFILALALFIIGAVVETLVLNHSGALNQVYAFSMMYS